MRQDLDTPDLDLPQDRVLTYSEALGAYRETVDTVHSL